MASSCGSVCSDATVLLPAAVLGPTFDNIILSSGGVVSSLATEKLDAYFQKQRDTSATTAASKATATAKTKRAIVLGYVDTPAESGILIDQSADPSSSPSSLQMEGNRRYHKLIKESRPTYENARSAKRLVEYIRSKLADKEGRRFLGYNPDVGMYYELSPSTTRKRIAQDLQKESPSSIENQARRTGSGDDNCPAVVEGMDLTEKTKNTTTKDRPKLPPPPPPPPQQQQQQKRPPDDLMSLKDGGTLEASIPQNMRAGRTRSRSLDDVRDATTNMEERSFKRTKYEHHEEVGSTAAESALTDDNDSGWCFSQESPEPGIPHDIEPVPFHPMMFPYYISSGTSNPGWRSASPSTLATIPTVPPSYNTSHHQDNQDQNDDLTDMMRQPIIVVKPTPVEIDYVTSGGIGEGPLELPTNHMIQQQSKHRRRRNGGGASTNDTSTGSSIPGGRSRSVGSDSRLAKQTKSKMNLASSVTGPRIKVKPKKKIPHPPIPTEVDLLPLEETIGNLDEEDAGGVEVGTGAEPAITASTTKRLTEINRKQEREIGIGIQAQGKDGENSKESSKVKPRTRSANNDSTRTATARTTVLTVLDKNMEEGTFSPKDNISTEEDKDTPATALALPAKDNCDRDDADVQSLATAVTEP